MFVTKKTHNRLTQKSLEWLGHAARWHQEYDALLKKWNDLVAEINDGKWVRPGSTVKGTFTSEEIDTLINLCHPDKHNGSERANKMTARLLQLRRKAP